MSKSYPPVFFIYTQKNMTYARPSLYRRLHGRREIRTAINEFGGVYHKIFEYPGIPHQDIAPGVIAVERKHVEPVEAIFKRFKVPFIKARPVKSLNITMKKIAGMKQIPPVKMHQMGHPIEPSRGENHNVNKNRGR